VDGEPNCALVRGGGFIASTYGRIMFGEIAGGGGRTAKFGGGMILAGGRSVGSRICRGEQGIEGRAPRKLRGGVIRHATRRTENAGGSGDRACSKPWGSGWLVVSGHAHGISGPGKLGRRGGRKRQHGLFARRPCRSRGASGEVSLWSSGNGGRPLGSDIWSGIECLNGRFSGRGDRRALNIEYRKKSGGSFRLVARGG
jgi:hypothetical protein